VNASVGDTIGASTPSQLFSFFFVALKLINATEWRFYPGGHGVVRADYKTPCYPYEQTGLNRNGFFSGNPMPQVVLNINEVSSN
jgi:hypothetical protein